MGHVKKVLQAWHWKIIGALIAVIAAVAGVGSWIAPDPAKPEPTKISIYDPAGSGINGTKRNPETLACARTSMTSPRRGAHTCVGARMLIDPCFERDEGNTVSCPSSTSKEKVEDSTYYLATYSDFYFDTTLLPFQKGVDSATKEDPPWLIELDREVNDQPLKCHARAGDIAQRLNKADAMTYWCGPNILILKNEKDFMTGDDKGAFQYQPTEGGRAVSLRRDNEVWKVQYAPYGDANFSEVAVTRAWF